MNKNIFKGLIFSGLIAVFAYFLGKNFPVVGGPVFGILLGIILNNFKRPESFEAGIKFTSKKVLQYAVILLGFGLNLSEIIVVGQSSLLIILSTGRQFSPRKSDRDDDSADKTEDEGEEVHEKEKAPELSPGSRSGEGAVLFRQA